LKVLQRWALLGRKYPARRVSPPDWSAVRRLIKTAEPHLLDQAGELLTLLKESKGKFGMSDPLLSDLGTHRWINKETTYSDWLAWVLEQLEPSAVMDVLGPLEPSFAAGQATKCRVQREDQLDKRFIDLVIQFDGLPGDAIGVEVKTDDQQYAKQKDYRKSLKARLGRDVPCVLIAIDAPKKDLHKFTLRPWRRVTFALREKIAEYAEKKGEDNRIVTAMMLGFVAAVEQNLLGFSPGAPCRVWRQQAALVPYELLTYLGGK